MEMIHVVFANDGHVTKISGCPAGVTHQEWFNSLSRKTANSYEALSGGRGVFRIPSDTTEKLRGEVLGQTRKSSPKG